MWKWIAIALAVVLVAGDGKAQDASPLKALRTADDSRTWQAVGRLNFADQSFCTGALIAEDIVLTAAHCVYDAATGQLYDPSEIVFLADWRGGRAAAYRGVRQVAAHPGFAFHAPRNQARVENDIAVLRLDHPVRNGAITPFDTRPRPGEGAEVGVVSYAHDRAETPALQEICHVLARQSGALILSCDVDFGSSGAPIFVIEDGRPQIVSVVSAKAEIDGRKVALGAAIERPLGEVLATLGPDPTQASRDAARGRPPINGTHAINGAKFVRP